MCITSEPTTARMTLFLSDMDKPCIAHTSSKILCVLQASDFAA
jgi:hypothetical protein